MIKYSIRSRQLIDIVGDIKRGKIILSPYFQRNLVWRLIHKQDFIKTILLGYPFPQIFLAKGGIDEENLTSTSLIVDGQQRMNSIIGFLDGEFDVEDNYFSDLAKEQRDNFLKYEVALIELEMESEDPQIKEIFKRLNRTFYSLTNIERLSTEFAPSEMMLVAKLLSDEIDIVLPKDEILIDPNVPESFLKWAKRQKVKPFHSLILETEIFSKYEISRKVHLMMTLNILGTIEIGFFNRNISTTLLEEYKDLFPNKDEITTKLNGCAKKYLDLKLDGGSYWLNKANFFSLLIILFNNYEEIVENMAVSLLRRKLNKFEKDLPPSYELAAKESVNNKKERLARNRMLTKAILG